MSMNNHAPHEKMSRERAKGTLLKRVFFLTNRELQISGKFPPSNLHGETANLQLSCIFAFSLFQICMADCERTRSQTRAQTGTDIGDHVEEPTEAFAPDLGNPTPNSDEAVESNSHETGAAGGEGSGAPKRLNFKFVEDRTVLLV